MFTFMLHNVCFRTLSSIEIIWKASEYPLIKIIFILSQDFQLPNSPGK